MTIETKDRIMEAQLALHAATSRLLDDAEILRQRRDELWRLVASPSEGEREGEQQ